MARDTKTRTRTRKKVNDNVNFVSADECPCGEDLDEGAVMLSCSECGLWWHACCVNLKGISEDMAATIKDWRCPHCFISRFTTGKLIKATFPEIINSGATTFGKEEVRKIIKEELAMAKTEIIACSKENVKSYASVLKNEVKETAEKTTSKELAKQVVVQMDVDHVERRKRESNIVVKGVKEVSTNDTDSGSAADLEFLSKTCDIVKEEIVSCFRAGKKIVDSDGKEVPRPLVAKLKSKEKALLYTKNGKGSMVENKEETGTDGKPIRYWINLDLCRADREAQFFVRQEQRKRLSEKKKKEQSSPSQTEQI